ncbi:sigma-54 dependent transcriptional regulator [uncultured Desulfuromusa sp.]|uniref:sigma-54 interaction domain-containing protein n=1 Tax=uncultured Desulfuromusa sp. TaxID=219183 RepID=UPI002AA6D82B|nr:sigma-54 dependent transcriptional regulator [uncultured Desulfuromusa sp.]
MTLGVSKSEYLPVVASDIVMIHWGHGAWQVQSLSERLTHWLKLDSSSVKGRSPEALFPAAVPSVATLAADVIDQGKDLIDVKLRLLPDQHEFLADIQFAGLTDDYLGQIVRINLRSESVASKKNTSFRNMVGSSPAMQEVFRKIRLYASSDAAIIITGETGAGKELVAQALHEESQRHDKIFAALNCAAISEQLLESELFGHERGAFTGALREHRGYFERANGGTLFLDEIGDMPLHTQTKLLRVLEDGRVQRVGGEKSHQVDVRFIGATNVPLEQAVAEKRFRSDLYHRLAVLRIHLPPLRERPEDIPLLADVFLQQFNLKYGKKIIRLTTEAIRLLQSYLWPGNIRELRNAIERVVVESETEAIGVRAFTEWIAERQKFSSSKTIASADENLRNLPVAIPYSHQNEESDDQSFANSVVQGKRIDLPEALIRQAYQKSAGNLSVAAKYLGVHRATLYRHLKRLNLTRQDLS